MSTNYEPPDGQMMPPEIMDGAMMNAAPDDSERLKPLGSQIRLPEKESQRVINLALEAYDAAWDDNAARIEACRKRYRTWRKKVSIRGGASGRSNFHVPLIVEKVLTKWAKTLDSFLGDDAEIVGQPTGPTDQAIQHKISRYMSWLVFNKMDIVTELARATFQEIMFGRMHALCYHDVKYIYDVKDGKYSKGAKTLWYEGPRFKTIPVDSFVVPPSSTETDPNDFEWVCIRTWKTPDQLLRDEANGYCYNIKDNIEAICRLAEAGKPHDSREDAMRQTKAEMEGVVNDVGQSLHNVVEVREHYFRHRMLKQRRKQKEYEPGDIAMMHSSDDVPLDDFKQRETYQTDLVIRYIPDIDKGALLIGCQNLAELYPLTNKRRPIVTASLVKTDEYWSPGFVERLEEIEIEKSVNHNMMVNAGEKMVNPPIFAVPGVSGFTPEQTRVEAGKVYWTQDPKSVNQMEFKGDLQFCIVRDQMLDSIADGVTGISATNAGRTSADPRSPKTFRGAALQLQQGDIRQGLETLFMQEDWSLILDHIKMLVDTYASAEEQFRVTEEQASGFFETNKGFATITAEERSGRYDFKLKFATSQQSREARKERLLQFLSVAAPMPVFVQNMNLQRDTLKLAAKELDLEGLLPSLSSIPDQNVPLTPQVEWTQALQGIDPQIHPQDDDQLHIQDHYKRIQEQLQLPEEKRDMDAVNRMIAHIMLHVEQQQQKQLMLAQAQAQANAAMIYSAMTGEEQPMMGGGNGQQGQQPGINPMQGGGVASILGAQAGMPAGGPTAGQQLAGFPGDTEIVPTQ